MQTVKLSLKSINYIMSLAELPGTMVEEVTTNFLNTIADELGCECVICELDTQFEVDGVPSDQVDFASWQQVMDANMKATWETAKALQDKKTHI